MLRGVLAIRGQAAARGYGFIGVEGHEDDVFVLGSEVTDEHGGPATRGEWSALDGRAVEIGDVITTARGDQATNVRLLPVENASTDGAEPRRPTPNAVVPEDAMNEEPWAAGIIAALPVERAVGSHGVHVDDLSRCQGRRAGQEPDQHRRGMGCVAAGVRIVHPAPRRSAVRPGPRGGSWRPAAFGTWPASASRLRSGSGPSSGRCRASPVPSTASTARPPIRSPAVPACGARRRVSVSLPRPPRPRVGSVRLSAVPNSSNCCRASSISRAVAGRHAPSVVVSMRNTPVWSVAIRHRLDPLMGVRPAVAVVQPRLLGPPLLRSGGRGPRSGVYSHSPRVVAPLPRRRCPWRLWSGVAARLVRRRRPSRACRSTSRPWSRPRPSGSCSSTRRAVGSCRNGSSRACGRPGRLSEEFLEVITFRRADGRVVPPSKQPLAQLLGTGETVRRRGRALRPRRAQPSDADQRHADARVLVGRAHRRS